MGLDSIVGVEWINTINQTYGLEIQASELYDFNTLSDLAEYIAKVLSRDEKTAIVESQKSPPIDEEIDLPVQQLETKVNLSELKQVLKQQLADVLYVEIDEIEEEKTFIELGLDSIVGVEWINTINQTYGLEIKASELYDFNTLSDLAKYIAKVLSKDEKTAIVESQKSLSKDDKINIDFEQDIYKNGSLDINHSSEKNQNKLRSILEGIANNELTIQAANVMIEKLKQNPQSQDNIINKNVFEVLKKSTREVVTKLAEEFIETTDSLKNLGIDSVDRAEIIMMVMEELDLHIPLIELAPARNIGELADLFAAKLEAHHGI